VEGNVEIIRLTVVIIVTGVMIETSPSCKLQREAFAHQ
jgi:hypothetical protein